MEKRYFDIVASIYTETCRTNSYLVCGGFSTDEEAMNLAKYQEAYNLAAKVIAVMSETYDTLINTVQ